MHIRVIHILVTDIYTKEYLKYFAATIEAQFSKSITILHVGKGWEPWETKLSFNLFFFENYKKNRAMLELPPFTDMQNCNFEN